MIRPQSLPLAFMVICSPLFTLDGFYSSLHAQPSSNNSELRFKEGLIIKTNVEGQVAPQVYNLLTFQGVANRWEGIELELERKLNPKDQNIYQQYQQINRQKNNLNFTLNIPAPGWKTAGHLRTTSNLVSDIWVIWIPSGPEDLSPQEKHTYIELLQTIKDHVNSNDYVSLIQGRDSPKFVFNEESVEDWNLQKWVQHFKEAPQKTSNTSKRFKRSNKSQRSAKSRHQRDSDHRAKNNTSQSSSLSISTSAIHALWFTLHKRLKQFWEQSRQTKKNICGYSCYKIIPHVKLLILANDIKIDIPINKEILSSTSEQLGHFLYGLHILRVTTDPSPPPLPPSILQMRKYLKSRPASIMLDQLGSEIDALRRYKESSYYLLPPTPLPIYYWSRGLNQWNIRSKEKKYFYQEEISLKTSKDGNMPSLDLKQYDIAYQQQLEFEMKQIEHSQKGNIGFKVAKVLLWLGLLYVIYILMNGRKKYPPKHISQRGKQNLKEVVPHPIPDQTPQPSRIKNLKNHISSHLLSESDLSSLTAVPLLKNSSPIPSPSVDPNDPTTKPAPAVNEESLKQIPTPFLIPSTDESTALNSKEQDHVQHNVQQQDKSAQDVNGSHLISVDPPVDPSHPNFELWRPDHSEINQPTEFAAPLAGLYAEKGPMHLKFFVISTEKAQVGRGLNCACILPPYGPYSDPKISRVHCEFTYQLETWQVRCLSEQGMYVEQTLIQKGESHSLYHGDRLVIGDSQLRFKFGEQWHQQEFSKNIK